MSGSKMRVLLITYYFPPCGGAPVQRWLKWLPDLVANGFEVTVLTTEDGDYPVRDESLLAEIPQEIEVVRCPAPNPGKIWSVAGRRKTKLPYGDLSKNSHPGKFKRILIWLRLNLIVPDLRVVWNPGAYWCAVGILRTRPIDLIITTGPPHSTHLLGLKLRKRFPVKWAADWRDPWSTIYYLQLNPPLKPVLAWHQYLERRVARGADLNVFVSEYLARQFKDFNTTVLYNGFDSRKLSHVPESYATDSRVFRIKYVGRLTEGQDFDFLLKIIEDSLADKSVLLKLVGTALSGEQVAQLTEILPDKHEIIEFVPHSRALDEMANSEALILLINDYPGFEGMLTTKLFEYLASGTPILCLGPHGSEAESLISEYKAGGCFARSETQQAGQYLRGLFTDWQTGQARRVKSDVGPLSSQAQALKLIGKLHAIEKD